MDPTYYGIGSDNLFHFVRCQNEIEMLRAAHQAITNCELWDWLVPLWLLQRPHDHSCSPEWSVRFLRRQGLDRQGRKEGALSER